MDTHPYGATPQLHTGNGRTVRRAPVGFGAVAVASRRSTKALCPRWVSLPILAIAPVVSVGWIIAHAGGFWLAGWQLPLVLAAVLTMWSPLPWSVPALMTQDARDEAMPELRGLVGSARRAVALVPYLSFSDKSPVRAEMIVSLVGFTMALVVAAPRL